MRKLFVALTLGLGTLITVSVSLGCSFWFFYSFISTGGTPAIAAGLAGCAFQLFAYGFASYVLNIRKLVVIPLWLVMCCMPLLLSIFTTYTTLYGFLTASEKAHQNGQVKTELILSMMEQNKRDSQIAASAAEQGFSDKRRTQAERLMAKGREASEANAQLLSKLDAVEQAKVVGPLDGMIEITGDSKYTKMIFCAWLSFLFDFLPILSIGLIGKKSDADDAGKPRVQPVKTESIAPAATRTELPASPIVDAFSPAPRHDHVPQPVISAQAEPTAVPIALEQPDVSPLPTSTAGDESNGPSGHSFDELLDLLKTQQLDPDYESIMRLTGFKKSKVQEFVKFAKEQGIIEKSGRKLVVKIG